MPKLTSSNKFSKNQLIVFGLLFALIGSVVLWRSFALNPNLPGDVNNDNVVNITDMSILLSNYGTNYSAADFNSSGLVDITDLSILLTNYNKTYTSPPPPPPQPSGFVSPLGFLSNRAPGYFPTSNIDKYGVISSEGPAPASFRGVNLVYRSTITCGSGYTNISEQECISNGWAMIGTDGKVMRNGQYGGVLADPGNPNYQRRWLDVTLAYMRQHESDSFWGDDFTPRVSDFNYGVWPSKYPNMQAYQDNALLPFARFIKAELEKLGIPLPAYNTAVSADDNASQTAAWWRKLGPNVGYLTAEYWLVVNGTPRKMGPEWFNHWDGWRALHQVCVETGSGFLPLPSNGGQIYTLATFLLDWDSKKGSVMWVNNDLYNSTVDPWIPAYGSASRIGTPRGPATQNGNVWTRIFASNDGGADVKVTVDPFAGTASIN